MKATIDIENIQDKFFKIVESKEWKEFQEKFNSCKDIYVIGHGGNLAVADHTAIDITRLSGGSKNAVCPGSGVVATSLINDTNFDQWLVSWLSLRTATRSQSDLKSSLVYGISSSGTSTDVIKALQWASDRKMKTVLITGQPISINIPGLTVVCLDTKFYHTAEVLTLLLQYQLTQGSGKTCPPIGKNKPDDIEKFSTESTSPQKIRFSDELENISIDFDGVIHKNRLGYHDGTIYDDPVEGVRESLELLSSKYKVIVTTCKAKYDRGLVNGKTGTQLVWEWLEKHDLSRFVHKVTSEKPRAVCYIDDKAIQFTSWQNAIKDLEEKSIL